MKDDVSRRQMSLWSMSLAGIRYGWRVSFSVALGVATATAVIVGALLVGDSMRGSLRELTVERLGRIDSLVMPMNFFEAEGISDDAVPVIFFTSGIVEAKAAGNFEDPVKWFETADGNGDSLLNRAELQQAFEADRRDLADWLLEDYDDDDDGELTLEEFLRADGAIRRAGSIQIIGCDERFWDLGVTDVRPSRLPGDNGVIMNQSAADELGVKVGDQVTVRLPVEQAVPADSPLGRRDVQTEGLPRMEVIDVVPDRGLGRFAITPSQAAPQNVYLSLETVADVLDRQGQANLLLFDQPTEIDDLQVGLDDLGMNLERVRQTFDSGDGDADVIYDYFSLTSDQLLLPEPAVERITEVLGDDAVMPVMTYLANAIERLDDSGEVVASVPYSTITAIESSSSLPLDFTGSDVDGQASDRVPLVINNWTASRLDAQRGTPLRVAYFEPEVEEGREVERFFDAVVTDIVPITEPATPYTRRADATFSEPPTVYNDSQLTPTVPGVTDQASINDWDLPFPLERDITNEDDEYWGQYRLTPKAFLPLEEGRSLFGSRFGQTTSLRISVEAFANEEALRTRLVEILQPMLADLGWAVRPIRQQQLAASRGTTPFDYLFLALSFFVILARPRTPGAALDALFRPAERDLLGALMG